MRGCCGVIWYTQVLPVAFNMDSRELLADLGFTGGAEGMRAMRTMRALRLIKLVRLLKSTRVRVLHRTPPTRQRTLPAQV